MLQFVWGAVVSLVQGYESGKQQFFANHLEPLHQRMLVIHKDYLAGFAEAKRYIDSSERPTVEVVSFLRQRRRDLVAERNLAQALSLELGSAERRIVRDEVWDGLQMYCHAVCRYLGGSSSVGGLSWYSEFIDCVESRMRLYYIKDSAIWTPGGFRDSTKSELAEWIAIAIDRELPTAFDPINKHYAFLRTRLL